MVQPQVVIGYAHLVEGDLLGVLEEAVGSPDAVQPLHVEDPVLLVHILRKSQARISP